MTDPRPDPGDVDEAVHIYRDDGTGNLCDEPGPAITLGQARDPDDGRDFTCGRCALTLAGGAEPMGGTAR